MKKTTKKLLTIATAGMFVFSTTSAFAEDEKGLGLDIVENRVENDNSNVVDVSTGTTNNEAPATIEESVNDDKAEEETSPSLLPGDFFYFLKMALEKIQLAFTFDDVEEAKLLAAFATERLAEAEALFAKGEQDRAIDTINDALIYLADANKVTDEDSVQNDDQMNDENVQDNQNVADDESEAEAEAEAEDLEADSPATEEAETVKDEEETQSSDDPQAEVEKLISQNIIALTAAMEKVKNPVAKAALQRNIEKSYEKLARKYEKLKRKYADMKIEEQNASVIIMPTEEVAAEGTKNDLGLVVVDNSETTEIKAEDQPITEVIKQEHKTSVKEVKKELKAVQKELKKEEKQVKQQEKKLEKQVKHNEKKLEKQAKKEEKDLKKQEKREAKAGQKESRNKDKGPHHKEHKNNGRE